MSTRYRLKPEPVLEILDAASRPLYANEIADAVGASSQAVGKILSILRDSGQAIKLGERPVRWIGGDGILKSAGDAYLVLIALYRWTDPRLANLLEDDYKNFHRSIVDLEAMSH